MLIMVSTVIVIGYLTYQNLLSNSTQDIGVDINSKIYVMDGWLDVKNRIINKQPLQYPKIDENRFIASNKIISSDGQYQAFVTADKEVRSYKGVLPNPLLIVANIQGDIVHKIPLNYTNTLKNVPGYPISFSKNGEKIALLSEQYIEIANLLDGTTKRTDLSSYVKETCELEKWQKKECDEFSFYFYEGGDVLGWLNDSSLLIKIHGLVYRFDLSSSRITRLQNLDHVDKFQILNSNIISYVYMPNWDLKSSVIQTYDVINQRVVRTFFNTKKGVDVLVPSPDGNFILLGDTSCGDWDVDCGGPYRITVSMLSLVSGKRQLIIKNYSYKQGSNIEIFWLK